MTGHYQQIAGEIQVRAAQVEATARLLAEGATVPFIARYRKEATGSLDEVAIAQIRDRLEQLAALDKRRASILGSLEERGLLTPELGRQLQQASSLAELEDWYLPFRPKRRSRAQVARERGLEALATALLAQDGRRLPIAEAVDPEREVPDEESALAGARDIIAELVTENPELRGQLRELFSRHALLVSSVIKKQADSPEADRFRDWFDWSEPLHRAPSHRILALLRGAAAGVLRLRARPDTGTTQARVRRHFQRGSGFASQQVALACDEAYIRLLEPALEKEALDAAKQRADAAAIAIFQTNLQELLLAPPYGQRRVLAIDPGLRTGCKVVALDEQGRLLTHDVVYLVRGGAAEKQAGERLRQLCQEHRNEAIAIGNGTASRETEHFVRGLGLELAVVMVNESGASVYSASPLAREEFPDHDLTVRGAVSIGRRLQDPLAELVKLDPKVIGVGQYQHDVDQSALQRALDDTIERCVNMVGVELNSASPQLLTHVAGLGPKLAQAIVAHRSSNGPFRSRHELLKVPRLGAKAFEQCAGFLRIRNGAQPLDASAVHPERYALVARMAADQHCRVEELLRDASRRQRIELARYCTAEPTAEIAGDDRIGEPTLRDILAELDKPGRDPRASFTTVTFADVHQLSDLQPDMLLPGVITNVTAFGAFVDIGVHQDGLVHISQLADHFVRDPAEVVKVRQEVRVRVLEVDHQRRRIALSMKGL